MAEILVEFVPDFTKLESGVEQLVSDKTISKEMAALFTDAGKSLDQFGAKFAKLGGGTTLKPAIDAAKKSISDLSKSGISDLGELKKRVDGITKSFIDGFGEGVETALKDAGISMEQFNKVMQQTANIDKSLKVELREINEEMARLKLNGQDNTERYQQLSKKAGEYRDTLQDVNEEINRQASDTGKLDVAIRFVSNLAAAYSVLQGIQGLVGKDNEELQKTLLKVNSAMSILNGLQAIQSELKRKDNILTIIQTNLQKAYAVVVGTSTGAMKAFRIALAATGIGALIVGIGLLVEAFQNFTTAAEDAAEAQRLLREEQEKFADNLDKEVGASEKRRNAKKGELDDLKRELEIRESSGASENTLFNLRQSILQKELFNAKVRRDSFDQNIDAEKEFYQDAVSLVTDKETQLIVLRNEFAKKQRENAEKNSKERSAKNKELAEKELQDQLAAQKIKLLNTKENSIAELEAQRQVSAAELALALNNDKLTFNQRKLLVQQFFKDQKELTNQFNEDNNKKVLEDYASLIATQLSQLNLSFEEREKLTVDQLNIEKEIQLAAVKNNETKRAEIIAGFDKQIIETRRKIHEEAFNEELEDTRRNLQQRKAILEENLADEKLPFQQRKEALQELSNFEFTEFTKRRLFNQQQLKNKEIDEKEFSKKAIEINNDEQEAKKKNEKKFTEFTEGEAEKRLKVFQETVGVIADFANQAIGSLKGFLDTIAANEDARIDAQKDSLERLRQNGIISQKEYEARLKVIDRLDKTTKQKQAEREKAIALFEAFVNGAAAIIKAAPNVALIAATSVLVAAQIAAIVARQIPKFGKGTKSAPKGFAEVGETGTELIQMNGKYFVADHPQVIWMKGGERVYNPNETKDILTPQANMTVINNSNGHVNGSKVDYDRMAKKIGEEIARHPRSVISLDEDGFSVHITNKLNTQKYLNKRFTFND